MQIIITETVKPIIPAIKNRIESRVSIMSVFIRVVVKSVDFLIRPIKGTLNSVIFSGKNLKIILNFNFIILFYSLLTESLTFKIKI